MQKYDHIELMLVKQAGDYRLETDARIKAGYSLGRLFICAPWVKRNANIESDYIVFEMSNKPSKNAFHIKKVIVDGVIYSEVYDQSKYGLKYIRIFIFATLKRTFELIDGLDVYVKIREISKEEYKKSSWGDYLPESVTSTAT